MGASANEAQIFTYELSLKRKLLLVALMLILPLLVILLPVLFLFTENPGCPMKLLLAGALATLSRRVFSAVGFVLLLNLVIAVSLCGKFKYKVSKEGLFDNRRFIAWDSIKQASIRCKNATKLLVLDVGTKRKILIPWPLEPQHEFESFIRHNLPETNPLSQALRND